jgi:ABC-type multidrug transport system fused ATPase/permease subunit
MFRTFAFFSEVTSVALALALPYVLQAIIQRIQNVPNPTMPQLSGLALAFLFFFMSLAKVIFVQMSQLNITKIMFSVQMSLSTAIYEKSLRMGNSASVEFSDGMILQMMNNDVKQTSFFPWDIPNIIIIPTQVSQCTLFGAFSQSFCTYFLSSCVHSSHSLSTFLLRSSENPSGPAPSFLSQALSSALSLCHTRATSNATPSK